MFIKPINNTESLSGVNDDTSFKACSPCFDNQVPLGGCILKAIAFGYKVIKSTISALNKKPVIKRGIKNDTSDLFLFIHTVCKT